MWIFTNMALHSCIKNAPPLVPYFSQTFKTHEILCDENAHTYRHTLTHLCNVRCF